MHIPANMLHGGICPVTAAVGAAGVAGAAYLLRKCNKEIPHQRWASVTALIFVMQMLNFPVTNATSGHLVGSVLLVLLLGLPRAVLSMAFIILTQAVLLGDGGIDALGANILNMAVIGVGAGYLTLKLMESIKSFKLLSIAAASMVSVILATLVCTIEVSASSIAPFPDMAKYMLPVHVMIGLGESVLTLGFWLLLSPEWERKREPVLILRTAFIGIGALALLPIASKLPDGLQWTSAQLSLLF